MKLPRDPDRLITIDMKKAQISLLVLSLIAIAIGFLLAGIIHSDFTIKITFIKFLLFSVYYFVGIILHEFFHLLGFILWGKCRWSDLVFGINKELGIAYAGTKKTLRNHTMKKALLLPFWLTGLLPFIVGIYLNDGPLIVASAFLIGGAAGDFAMYKQLREVSDDAYIIDDLQLPQLYVYDDDPHQNET